MSISLADFMQLVAPGLWRWTAPHPDWSPWDPQLKTSFAWPQEVASVCYEAPEHLVLIDPLAPPANTPSCQRFWRVLDEAVRRKRLPVAVLLSTDWHDRSAQAVYDRYSQDFGVSIWLHEAAPRSSLACRPTHMFRADTALPGNAQGYCLQSPHPEVVFYLSSARALVVADALWGSPDGRIWLGSYEVCALLPRLLAEKPIEKLLLSHGDPVLSAANAVLARILDDRPEHTEVVASDRT